MPRLIFKKIPSDFDPHYVRGGLTDFFGNAEYIDAIYARKNAASKRDSVYALVCLSELIKTHFSSELPVRIQRNEGGKPYLVGSQLSFSISHSSGYVAVAVCDNGNIGIDIEKVDLPIERYERISSRYFAKGEQSMVQNEGFAKAWTAKEAYAKYLGIGLSATLQKCDITSDEIYKMLSWQEADGMLLCLCHR